MKRSAYLDYVLEQLAPVGRIRARGMFGGFGIYCGESFFALVASDTLYFKADERNRADYLRRGKGPFMPFPEKPQRVMHYYEVPADVLEDTEELASWACKSLAVAADAKRVTVPKKKQLLKGRKAAAARIPSRKARAFSAKGRRSSPKPRRR
jgi:DNA transformation protein